ncbi:MAG: hypothetical protein WCI18_14595, partial [Pseudomonadota bacterium]
MLSDLLSALFLSLGVASSVGDFNNKTAKKTIQKSVCKKPRHLRAWPFGCPRQKRILKLKEAARPKDITRRQLDIQLESKSLVRESISIKSFMEKMSQYLKVTPRLSYLNQVAKSGNPALT